MLEGRLEGLIKISQTGLSMTSIKNEWRRLQGCRKRQGCCLRSTKEKEKQDHLHKESEDQFEDGSSF